MNTLVTDSFSKYPDFFESWRLDPMGTFIKMISGGGYIFGFPSEGREDFRGPFEICLDALGIGEYWNPTLMNPGNVDFIDVLDGYVESFLTKTKPNNVSCSAMISLLGGLTYGPYVHLAVSRWVYSNYRATLPIQMESVVERCAISTVSNTGDRGDLFLWILNRILQAPASRIRDLEWLFRDIGGGVSEEIVEFFPQIIRSHRRKLHSIYTRLKKHSSRKHRSSRKSSHTVYKEQMELLSGQMCSSISSIFFHHKTGSWKYFDSDGYDIEEADQNADQLMRELKGYCPFPPI